MTTASAKSGPSAPPRGWMARWLSRRGPLHPPLALRYRQIFILPTRFGWILGLLMAAMMLGSLNFNNNLGLMTSFIVAGLAVLSMFQAYRNLAGLEVLGVSAAPVHAGQHLQLEVTLQGNPSVDHRGLYLRCGQATGLTSVPAGSRQVATLSIATSRRGWLKLPRMRIFTRHPLGLFEAWSWVYPPHSLLVYPRPAVPAPPLPAGGGSQGRPDRRSEGEEFHSLRSWRSGDPLHRIAWKASQRHEELLSRQFQAENSDEIHLSLDRAPGADAEERIRILTAWVLAARQTDLAWTLELPGLQLGPASDSAHAHQCLQALALSQP